MRQLRYQGNFCTECGNPLTASRGWLPRVFCEECARHLRYRQRLPSQSWPWLVLLAAGSLFYLLNQPATPPAVTPIAAQSLTNTPSVITTTDAALSAISEPAFCGARTRKGTPCRRLVKIAGLRCAQHRGQPSLLIQKTTSQPE